MAAAPVRLAGARSPDHKAVKLESFDNVTLAHQRLNLGVSEGTIEARLVLPKQTHVLCMVLAHANDVNLSQAIVRLLNEALRNHMDEIRKSVGL